jgi:multisubunit Na+/H+ antiporter MnhC subunit
MGNDVIIGIVIIFAALAFMTYLVLRSRKTIEFVHRKKLNSAREIIQSIDGTR